MKWRVLEVWIDSSATVHYINNKDAIPVEVSLLIDKCLGFKISFSVVLLERLVKGM